jgi:hypothetical protein
MWHSLGGGHPGMQKPPLHSLHYVGANDAEVAVNIPFLNWTEIMFGRHTTFSVEDRANIFRDFIAEGRKV